MIAEALREVGVLTGVLGLLDEFVAKGSVPWPHVAWFVGLAVTSFAAGVIIERRR
jgi:hypothetical protein